MAAPTVPSGARPEKLPARVRLPRSTSRLACGAAYCRIVQAVKAAPFQAGFEGPFHPAGSEVEASEFSDVWLVLERCGTQGSGRNREILWKLWRWDREWIEVARAQAVNWEWALVLEPIARALLYPPAGLQEVLSRGSEVACRILDSVDSLVDGEALPVRKQVWAALYDRVAGRLVDSEE